MQDNGIISYQDLKNDTVGNITTLVLSGNDPMSIPYIDAGLNIADYIATNGQILIGSTGAIPIASSITGTTNQLIVTNGAGSITLSTPQNIDSTASPTFANLTDTGLTGALVGTTAAGLLENVLINNSNGSNITYTPATGVLQASLLQSILTSASPTFAGLTDSGLTATELVATDGSKKLQSVIITNANGCNSSFTGSTLTQTMTQNLGTTGAPTFGSVTLTSTPSIDLPAGYAHSWLTTNNLGQITGVTTGNLDGHLPIGSSGTGWPVDGTISGTTKQIIVTNAPGTITLSTPQNIDTAATVTFGNIIDSGITANSVVLTNGSQQLVPASFSSTTGMLLTVAAGAMTIDTPQSVQTSATPTFANLIDSGLTASALVATTAGKQLESVTILNTNGCNFSFAGVDLTATMTQDISTAGSPSFSNITDTGIAGQNIVCTNNANKFVALSINNSTNGVTSSITADALTISTPQDVRTTASPTFGNVIQLTNFYGRGNSTTSITNATFTEITFTMTVSEDPSTMFNGTNTWTIASMGRYYIWATIRINDHAVGAADTTGLEIYQNGSAVESTFFQPDGSGRRTAICQTVVLCAPSDTINFYAYQSSGATLTAGSGVVSIAKLS